MNAVRTDPAPRLGRGDKTPIPRLGDAPPPCRGRSGGESPPPCRGRWGGGCGAQRRGEGSPSRFARLSSYLLKPGRGVGTLSPAYCGASALPFGVVFGSQTRNVVRPGSEVALMLPPCSVVMMRQAVSRPRPVPCPCGLDV